MSAGKMHANEVETDAALVHRLLAAQFPQWAALPLAPVESAGTDNAIYRLGDDMVVRLPRIDWAVGQIDKDWHWLPRLAPFLPCAIPAPLARGRPDTGYPWPWTVHRWLPGANAALERPADPCQTARDLARFIRALQQIGTARAPSAAEHNLRGVPLARRDAATRAALAQLNGIIDVVAATEVWNDALRAPSWDQAPVWFHGDMLPGNVLIHNGQLSAVIDWGGLGVGDPACDLMIAWALFEGRSRAAFRAALDIDDATWTRGRAHALSQAAIFIPYYLHTNPVGVSNARRTIDAVLADARESGTVQ